MPNAPAPPHPSTPKPARPSLGFLPPLLALIEAFALLVVAFLIWRFFNNSHLASLLLVPALLLSFIPYLIAVYVCGDPRALTSPRAILFFALIFRLIFLA